MTLNKNGLSATFYKHTYGTSKLPDNLCVFFWKLLWALILFPLTIFGVTYSLAFKGNNLHNSKGIIIKCSTAIVIYLWFCLSLLVGVKGFGIGWVGLFLLPAAAISLFVILFVLIGTWEYLTSKTRESEIINITVEFAKAKKNKYCPKITWN